MKRFCTIWFAVSFYSILLLSILLVPQLARAQWHAAVGAENKSMSHQALAFLPDELWIHAGDTVTWTFNSDEIHTVSFLQTGQVRLPFNVGCPGYALGAAATVDGSACISTPPLVKGQKFTVTFPTVGNFKLVCLVHQNMTGVVHVLEIGQPLPHWQDFYEDQAESQQKALLSDDDDQQGKHQRHNADHDRNEHNSVTVGRGEVTADGGGSFTFSVMRFMEADRVIHAGETIEWTNLDPVTPHTITFGVEPMNPVFPINATLDPDGALHGTIASNADSVHSGLIGAAPQDEMFQPTPSLALTRFRITFTHAGVYPYKCALHDGLGMKGKITVVP